MGFEPDMKLTPDWVNLIGGNIDTPSFRWFIELTVRAYLTVRPYTEVSACAHQLNKYFYRNIKEKILVFPHVNIELAAPSFEIRNALPRLNTDLTPIVYGFITTKVSPI